MKQKILGIFIVFASVFLATSQANQAYAAACAGVISGIGDTLPPYYSGLEHVIVMDISSYDPNDRYYVKVKNTKLTDDQAQTGSFRLNDGVSGSNGDSRWEVSGGKLYITITEKEALAPNTTDGENGSHFVELYKHEFGSNRFCEIGYYYTPKNTLAGKCTFTITQQRTGADGNTQACYAAGQASCMEDDKPVQIEVSGLEDADGPYNGAVRFVIGAEGWDAGGDHIETSTNGTATTSITPNSSASFAEGKTYTVKMEASRLGINFDFPDQSCTTKITISDYCAPEQCGDEATIGGAQAIGPDEFKLCSQIKDPVAFEACTTCAGGEDGEDGIWTAIGCISREPEEIVGKLIRLGLSMGGGIALLMILSAGFTLTVSQGNPQKAGQAKEMITAAVTGLLFIIFSVTILQFIGFSVLKIPGFGGP